MADNKEALTALRGAKDNLTKIIARNSDLESALERACQMLNEAMKYVGEGAYIYPHGNQPVSCRSKIGNNIAELRAVIDK